MKIISRNDYRILELLNEFLIRHETLEHIPIFIHKLEAYSNALGRIDSKIGESLHEYWFELEIIFASYRAEEREEPTKRK